MRRNHLGVWIALPAAVLLGACNPMGDWGNMTFGFGPEKQTPYTFRVSPDGGRLLKGDTVSFEATTCPEPCYWGTPVQSDWSVSGIALEPLSELAASSTLLTGAAGSGTASVTGTLHADTARKWTSSMVVIDSTDVDEIRLTLWSAIKNSQGVYEFKGATQDISANIRANGWPVLRGRATSWSSSDTTIVVIVAHANPYLANSRTLVIKKAGTVDITARFLSVEASVRLLVSP